MAQIQFLHPRAHRVKQHDKFIVLFPLMALKTTPSPQHIGRFNQYVANFTHIFPRFLLAWLETTY